MEPENALKAMELELKTIPGSDAKNATLSMKISLLNAFVETLGREKRDVLMITQGAHNLVENYKKI